MAEGIKNVSGVVSNTLSGTGNLVNTGVSGASNVLNKGIRGTAHFCCRTSYIYVKYVLQRKL